MCDHKSHCPKLDFAIQPPISQVLRHQRVIFKSHQQKWGFCLNPNIVSIVLASNLNCPNHSLKLDSKGGCRVQTFSKKANKISTTISKSISLRGLQRKGFIRVAFSLTPQKVAVTWEFNVTTKVFATSKAFSLAYKDAWNLVW